MNTVAQLDARPTTGTLRLLLFALGFLFAGMASYVAPWVSAFAFLLLGWRAWAAARNLRMPNRLIKTVLALTALVMVLASYRTLNGAEAGGALLLVMIALKLTEVHRIRDAVFVIALGYFLLFAGILYSQEIPFVAWMLAAGWALTAALLVVARNPPEPAFLTAMKHSGRFLLQALPFAVILFLLFPRIPGPLWGTPAAGAATVSGLDDTMTPGSISRLALSNEIAFRVRFHDEPPPQNERYWRGPTLHLFNGRTWMQGLLSFADANQGQPLGDPVRYSVMLEPHQRHWLYALMLPAQYPNDTALTRDYLLASVQPLVQRRSYEVTSYLDHVTSRELSPLERQWGLQLPDGFNPRARELAQLWRQDSGGDERAIIRHALAMFRDQEFRYTLEPPLLRGDTVDDFLFRTRAGFCEHYASAFVFLMRAARIPARVVTGYLGGEPNAFGDYYTVRQSDAHAWAEVWLPERGWVRVDPTGAVAPERVERGLTPALDGEGGGGGRLATQRLLIELELRWEAVNAVWNEFFLGFGPELQRSVLERLGMRDPGWRNMVIVMTVLIGGGGLILWAWLIWTHRPRATDPALRLYRQLQMLLARRLGPPRNHEGPKDFAARVAREAPELAPRVRVFVREYVALRYLPPSRHPEGLRRLREALKKVRKEK